MHIHDGIFLDETSSGGFSGFLDETLALLAKAHTQRNPKAGWHGAPVATLQEPQATPTVRIEGPIGTPQGQNQINPRFPQSQRWANNFNSWNNRQGYAFGPRGGPRDSVPILAGAVQNSSHPQGSRLPPPHQEQDLSVVSMFKRVQQTLETQCQDIRELQTRLNELVLGDQCPNPLNQPVASVDSTFPPNWVAYSHAGSAIPEESEVEESEGYPPIYPIDYSA
ncbi:unnamed protein product [Caretta caretta]